MRSLRGPVSLEAHVLDVLARYITTRVARSSIAPQVDALGWMYARMDDEPEDVGLSLNLRQSSLCVYG